MSSGLPSKDNNYQWKPAPAPAVLTREIWDTVFASVGSRLLSLEAVATGIEQIQAELQQFGLARLDDAIVPLIRQVRGDLAKLDADVAAAKQSNAASVVEFKAAVQAARAEIDVLLAGGLSADKVTETVTRLFLTSNERTEIAKLRNDLKVTESRLSVVYRWWWNTVGEDTTVWAYQNETYLVSPGASLLLDQPQDGSTIGIVTVGDVKAKPIKIYLYGHPFEGSKEPIIIARTVSLMLEYRLSEWRVAP